MHALFTRQYGPADALSFESTVRPEPKPGQIRVRVEASPVTAGDRRLRSANFPGISALFGRLFIGLFRPRHPVQGTMFAGRVDAVGQGVTDLQVGERVFGSVDHGAHAEYLVVDAAGPIARIPADTSSVDAAEVPYGGVTALRFLRDIGRIQPGESVLILGASGGVGRYAVQIARHLGAQVTAVCSAQHAALMRRLGAHHVLDHHVTDFHMCAERYDVIFDIADVTSFRRARRRLTPNGRYLTLFISLGAIFQMLCNRFRRGPTAHFGIALGTRQDMQDLASLLEEGTLEAVVAHQYPLCAGVDAHRRAESNHGGGVLLLPASSGDALRSV